jgi:hypothetical protein
MGHDYDNLPYANAAYPAEWIDQPLKLDPKLKNDWDSAPYIDRRRRPPLRQLRYVSDFALARPAEVDVSPVSQILALCNTPDHFTY